MPQPTRPDRRAALRLRNRQLIVGTAQRLFAERGFAGTSVARIAEEADVAASTVFNHFPHKEEIFFVGRCPWLEIAELLTTRPDEHTTAPELIGAVGDVVAGHLRRMAEPGSHAALVDLASDPGLGLWERGARRRAELAISTHIVRHAPRPVGAEAQRCAALTTAEAGTLVDEHRRALLCRPTSSPTSSPPASPAVVRSVLVGRLLQLRDVVVGQVSGPLATPGPVAP